MSVAGKWRVTMPTPIGTLEFVWDLTDTGGAWRGQMSGEPPIGISELTAIEAQANVISFVTTVKSPMGALQANFIGTATGDTMTGTCKTRFGDNQFSAVRV
jgi:hypothetical protein